MTLIHSFRRIAGRHLVLRLVCTIGLTLLAGPTSAQTREEELAAAQADKATRLQPRVPSAAERRIAKFTSLAAPRTGWYPFVGGVYPGGSFAAGAGHRGRVGGSGSFDAHVARSVKSFTGADAQLLLPALGNRRVQVALRANWVNAPRLAVFGLGPASRQEDKAGFLYRASTVGSAVQVDLTRVVAVGGTVEYLDIHTDAAPDGAGVRSVFDSASLPGLAASPAFARTHLFAEVDTRASSGYATSGGLIRADWSRYAARHNAPYTFSRVDAEVIQLIPLLRDNWVIALRALQTVTQTSDGNVVPYFLMPALGGGGTLRGYPSWRFRDRSRTLLSAEYRWMANRFLEMAMFTDAGTVSRRLGDLRRADLHVSYGIGGRFHTPAATVLRLDLARTSEGMALVVAVGPSF